MKLSALQTQMVEMKQKGMSSREIATILGVGKSTVNNTYNRYLMTNSETEQSDDDVEYDPDLDVLAKNPDYSVANLAKRLRTAQKTNNQLRKIQNESLDKDINLDAYLDAVRQSVARLKVSSHTPVSPKKNNRPEATVEVLFSDLQMGKVGEQYNTDKAIKVLRYYGQELIQYIEKVSKDYDISRVIFASLGDLMEDHLKHDVQSASSTDSPLSEQMSNVIVNVWEYVLNPLFNLGYHVDVMCIAGNHGSSNHKGHDMFKAGLFSYDYTVYTTWELVAKASGYTNVQFIIPEGVFGYLNVYGKYFIYEHGYFNNCTEKSMTDQMRKRGNQIKRHVEGYRCGDMHHVCSFDNHKLVVNGAFFGVDEGGTEYSGILGFNSIPAQVVMVHTPEEKLGRNTIKEFYTIQVA